ncbi:MAG: hypothetical protein A2505_05260 [Deltaproteobacteria bacterium RIFOXYD12_FULL_55_16]|nr:MAG: hypothetical protein A2505_05260 [Deltaproteobacteria bacterium RIFOXYD12_FULL_55_16]
MKRTYLIATLNAAILTAALAAPVWAAGEWSTTAGAQAVYGSYSGSTQRDQVTGFGAVLSSDYLERGGFTLGLNRTDIKMNTGSEDIGQNALFASGKLNFTPDGVAGRLTGRMDVHLINNDDATNDTDGVKAYAPQVSYLSFDKRRYFDLGYARSNYRNDLEVNQWTPTVGFALNEGADWVQLRGWVIDPSNAARAQGETSTYALEAKLTHWFGANKPLGLDNVRLSGLVGERIYAVDHDAGAVANLSDVQRGGVSLGGEWKLGKSLSMLAMLSRDNYRNATLADDYSLTSGYIWLAGKW